MSSTFWINDYQSVLNDFERRYFFISENDYTQLESNLGLLMRVVSVFWCYNIWKFSSEICYSSSIILISFSLQLDYRPNFISSINYNYILKLAISSWSACILFSLSMFLVFYISSSISLLLTALSISLCFV